MLILLSDLHFMDGTAGVDNLRIRVIERMLSEMADHARRSGATEVKIAFLGDIFDLVRTEHWFGVPPAERPWGETPSEAAAIAAFDAVVRYNPLTFELLSGELVDRCGFPVEPERVYVPGNHDRLCSIYPALRRKVRDALGMAPGDEPFPHVLLEPEYGVYGRHGHEFDPYNYEGEPVFGGMGDDAAERQGYADVPIGDVIAAEFASKLPVLVRKRVSETGPVGDQLVSKFRELFDVRPLAALVDWLELQRIKQPKPLEKVINASMQECAETFDALPFVEDWIARHDRWTNPLDPADKIQILLALLRNVDFTRAGLALSMARGETQSNEAHYPEMARRDFARLDDDPELRGRILYVVYGHTHTPAQSAVGVVGDRAEERHRMYLNTGTWRPSHRHALDDSGFVAWNNLTVTYVHKAGELNSAGHRLGYPTFETWTGAFS